MSSVPSVPTVSTTPSVPSVSTLQQAFLDTLDFIDQSGTLIQPSNSKQLKALKKWASQPNLTLAQLGALAVVPTNNRNAGMLPIQPFHKDPLFSTGFQFGYASLEWYFMYGNCDTFAFTFILFAIPVCPPKITTKYKLDQQSYIYTLAGGVGPVAQPGLIWYRIPPNFVQATYQQPTQSTFFWKAVVPSGSPIQSCQFATPALGGFALSLSWTDPASNKPVVLNASFSSADPPMLNGPKGCQPVCTGGIGSLYWSYTNMRANGQATLPNGSQLSGFGLGWLDHQWLQSGKMKSNDLAALQNLQTLHSSPSPIRWFWINLQDQVSNQQFMIVVYPGEVPQLNKTYRASVVNQYNSTHDSPVFTSGHATVKPVQIQTSGTFVWPTSYEIIITQPQQTLTYQLQATYGSSLVWLPTSVPNWEGCGSLSRDGKVVGNCFLEANNCGADCDINAAPLVQLVVNGLTVSNDDLQLFLPQTSSIKSAVWGALWLLLRVSLIVLLLWLVAHGVILVARGITKLSNKSHK